MGPSWLCAADVLSSSHLREHAWALLACAREEKQRTGRRLCLLPFASLPAFLPYCAVLYSMPWRASHFRGFRNAPNPFDRLRACFLVSPSLPALRACEPSLRMGAEKKHSVFSVFFVHVARSRTCTGEPGRSRRRPDTFIPIMIMARAHACTYVCVCVYMLADVN